MNVPTPTPPEDFVLFGTFSRNAIEANQAIFHELFFNNVTGYVVPAGVRRYDSEEEHYYDGVLFVTVKRDILGLPQLFCGHFSPFPASFNPTHEALLANGKISERAYIEIREKGERDRQAKIQSLRERLSNPKTDPILLKKYQLMLDSLELGT
eukprot:TRINITY_DN7395_c0_g1_i3.p1 TRINITY_DN7395_c0_g1~~TRINITY_DN7395_c0_g1_i3.p1  ORF type:complete len:153 (-),score=52.02 TRINITY_DN7395_c0_g1_i3:233-691(-)